MPHHLCAYAYNLTKRFSTFYNNIHILNEENEDKKIIRLQLIDMFSEVLRDSFKILGIDPGLNVTGYGIIEIAEGGNLQLFTYGTIRTDAKKSLSDRLLKIYEGLNAIMQEHHPQMIAIESIFFADNVKTAIVMGHARGAAIVAARQNSAEIGEYSPREIKLSVTGTGGAAKSQVNFMVKNLLKVRDPIKPDDASDALAVAICHFNRIKLAGR